MLSGVKCLIMVIYSVLSVDQFACCVYCRCASGTLFSEHPTPKPFAHTISRLCCACCGVAMDFGFWTRIMFMSERTIKIAYISAAQTGDKRRAECGLSRVVRRDWMAELPAGWGVARQSRLRSLICVQSRV